jgi:hypothetical protein
MSVSTRWTVRVFVIGAFLATVVLAGPRALTVLAARLDRTASQSPPVALDRVGFVERPEWMDQSLLVAVAAELSPWLADEVGILDESSLRALRDGLRTVSWVHDALIERVYPDKLRLRVHLRRPVLAVRAGDGRPLCLVDAEAVMLPWVETPLPETVLHREGGRQSMDVVHGARVNEPRVRAAVGVAIEWRDELAPLVPGCPPLLEVDATNLGERWVRGPNYPEIRVVVRREDGNRVLFGYDRPVDSTLPRVPVRTKATVLNNVLGKHPGLSGLVAGDLRFVRRWADYLQPRGPGMRDPNGPWKDTPRQR